MNVNDFIKDLKESLTDDDIDNIMLSLGARKRGNRFTSICHNKPECACNYNLAYIGDANFFCHSECGHGDIVEVVRRARRTNGENDKLFPTLKYICNTIGREFTLDDNNVKDDRYNWAFLKRYLNKEKSSTELQLYDESILECFDKVVYKDWEDEYITADLQDKYNIRYYPTKEQIIIPIYNYAGLVGIRVRNLVPESIEEYGKYRPLELLDGTTFKFPTGETLFGIDNIYQTDEVILVESEKAVMQLEGYGYKGVAMFGKNFTNTHLKLLLKAGVSRIVIGLDSDASDNDINKIVNKCKPFLECYVIKNDLGEKTSPTDKGKQIFEELYETKTKI